MTEVEGIPSLDRLGEWLAQNDVRLSGPLEAETIAGGRSNLTIRLTDGAQRWVLRRPPLTGLTPGAHDVLREYAVTSALQGSRVPVPRAVAATDDLAVIGAPFTVVEFVAGRTFQTAHQLAELTDSSIQQCHRELVSVLVALHADPPDAHGLGGFGRPAQFAARQVRLWRRQWDLVSRDPSDQVDAIFETLEARVPAVTEGTLVHGDYRIDNALLHPEDAGRILAVIDWEMATVGDPMTDIATMCVYRDAAFDFVVGEPAASTSPRWPSASQIMADYCATSGRSLEHASFYLGLAYFKLAVIAQGIEHRRSLGSGSGPGFDTARLAVPELIAAGLAALREDR